VTKAMTRGKGLGLPKGLTSEAIQEEAIRAEVTQAAAIPADIRGGVRGEVVLVLLILAVAEEAPMGDQGIVARILKRIRECSRSCILGSRSSSS
jgi:hypothetical protein